MKEKKLSENLKEIRFAQHLSQSEMAKTLGMGEKMYQLYESGKYDNVKKKSIRRQKLFDKIDEIKNKLHSDRAEKIIPSDSSDLAKENTELKKLLAEKQKIIDAQERIIIWQEHFFKKSRKSFAQATHPAKNKN